MNTIFHFGENDRWLSGFRAERAGRTRGGRLELANRRGGGLRVTVGLARRQSS